MNEAAVELEGWRSRAALVLQAVEGSIERGDLTSTLVSIEEILSIAPDPQTCVSMNASDVVHQIAILMLLKVRVLSALGQLTLAEKAIDDVTALVGGEQRLERRHARALVRLAFAQYLEERGQLSAAALQLKEALGEVEAKSEWSVQAKLAWANVCLAQQNFPGAATALAAKTWAKEPVDDESMAKLAMMRANLALGNPRAQPGKSKRAEVEFRLAMAAAICAHNVQLETQVHQSFAAFLIDEGRITDAIDIQREQLTRILDTTLSIGSVEGAKFGNAVWLAFDLHTALGANYFQSNAFELASREFDAALAMAKETLDDDDPRLAFALINCATCALHREVDADTDADTEEMLHTALSILVEAYGETSIEVAQVCVVLGTYYLRTKEFSHALELFDLATVNFDDVGGDIVDKITPLLGALASAIGLGPASK